MKFKLNKKFESPLKVLLMLLVAVLIASCKGDAKQSVRDGDFEIEFLFEKDGCKMYRFEDGGRYIYWSNCEGRSQYSYYQSTGKGGYTVHKQSTTSVKRN